MTKKKEKLTAEEISQSEDKIDVQAATLVGTIRDEMLAVFKSHADWKKMPEAKQRDVAASYEHLSKEVIRRASNIIAGRGFQAIHCTLSSIAVKDGLKLVLTASKMVEARRELMDHQGGGVTLVITDINPYMQNRSEPDIDEDEPALPLLEEGHQPSPGKKRKRK